MSRARVTEEQLGVAPVLPVRDTVHFPGLVHTLLVARKRSIRALAKALELDMPVISVAQRDMGVEDPSLKELSSVGTRCRILQALPLPDGSMRAVFKAENRVRLIKTSVSKGVYWASVSDIVDDIDDSVATIALAREAKAAFQSIAELNPAIPVEALQSVATQGCNHDLVSTIANHLPIDSPEKQRLLEIVTLRDRLTALHEVLIRELSVAESQQDIRERVSRDLDQTQRDFLLREQLRAIQLELGGDPHQIEVDDLKRRIGAQPMSEEARRKAEQETERLLRTPSHTPEGAVIRAHIDALLDLPWSHVEEDLPTLATVRAILDREHHGLERAKERILEFMAVRQISRNLRGPILCFVGPPGVGKTSLASAVASAMGRKVARMSLGGVRDEAEIRGHRRAYVGAGPGRIIQGMLQAGTTNPVFVLDEIDKMAMDFRGDPASALLEALDPSQNRRFVDHYLEVPYDLGDVFFIATANSVEGIPYALRDRLELVQFESFTEDDRRLIATKHLIPNLRASHGLSESNFTVPEAVLNSLIRHYARESGVRQLSRTIEALCRRAARWIVEGQQKKVTISLRDLEQVLGASPSLVTDNHLPRIGVVNGLVVSEIGGAVMEIEAALLDPKTDVPEVQVTGNLGPVLKESAELAVSFLRSVSGNIAKDVHIHLPSGGVPKDGPSAGLAIAVAIASALRGCPIPPGVALTGEITLRGRVLPVGGIRDKVLAAHREGFHTVVLPKDNLIDLRDLPGGVLETMTLIPVEVVDEAFAVVLSPIPVRKRTRG